MPRKKKSSRRSYSRRDSSDYDDSSYSSYSSRSDSRDRYSRDDSRGRYEDSRDRRRDRDRYHSSNSRSDRYAREGSRAREDRYNREGSRARDYSPRRRDDQRSSRRHRSNRDDRDRSYHRDDSYMDADEDRRGSSASRRSSIEKATRRSSSQRYDSDEDYDRNERSRGSRRRSSIEKPTRRSSSQRYDSDEDYDRNERIRARNEERKARKGRRREKSSRKLVPETNLQVQQRRNNNHFPISKLAQLPIGDNVKLKKMLEEEGLGVVDMSSDGNCLFRSLSDQLYNDQGHHHDEVRSDICDFMAENEAEFSMFLAFEGNGTKGSRDAKDYESYIADTRRDGVWGGNLELVAAARLYQRNITVYNSTLSVITIDCDCEETSGPDMLLSFHSGDHYNSVRAIPASKKSSRKNSRKLTRNASGGSSRRSLSDTATTTASTVSVAPVVTDMVLQDTNIVVATVVGIDDEPIRKNAQCPCGSGKRYKKCCGAKLKEEKKEERRKKDRRSPSRPRDNDGTESVASGFKVLAI